LGSMGRTACVTAAEQLKESCPTIVLRCVTTEDAPLDVPEVFLP
jgi:hypothetical protein